MSDGGTRLRNRTAKVLQLHPREVDRFSVVRDGSHIQITIECNCEAAAALIDLCEEQKNSAASHSVTITEPGHQFVNPQTAAAPNPEIIRLWSLAQTHFEDAAMWAVKAATAGK
jgi:hypothetical protein